MRRTAEEWGRIAVSLPGDIPGLLRRGSPVRWAMPGHAGRRGTLHYPSGGSSWACAYTQNGKHHLDVPLARELVLDLSDPTGRAHAAWWVRAHHHGDWGQVADAIGEVWTRCELAHRWSAMGVTVSDEQIDILRRIVLHVAGREGYDG